MQPTKYTSINAVIESLLTEQKKILKGNMVGLYLYGSLVTGDFDEDISDIDLLCAIKNELTNNEFDKLKGIHEDIVKLYPKWRDRIETQYVPLEGLRTFKTKSTKIGDISPGDPFHWVQAGRDWLLNWYVVQEKGQTIYGIEPINYIEHISQEEFISAVIEHTKEWKDYINNISQRRGSQAYAILTMCRAYYSAQNGKQASKQVAANFVQEQLPQYKNIVGQALRMRQNQWKDQAIDKKLYPQTVSFVHEMIHKIAKL